MSAQIIINADDFGASAEVNRAVQRARESGLLTSASLMVTGDGFAEAVDIARRDSGLAVGLHLTLTQFRSVLPACEISALVNSSSEFPSNPLSAALKYYFSGYAREQIRAEIEAQFRVFAETGLALSHVDGHQHMHLLPILFPIVLELAEKYGASGIRIPYDPFWINLMADRSRLAYKALTSGGHAYLTAFCFPHLANSYLNTCDVSIGTLMSGKMTAGYVRNILKAIHAERIQVIPSDPIPAT
jgi:hopanoid biosynthesis associated protein HpnK